MHLLLGTNKPQAKQSAPLSTVVLTSQDMPLICPLVFGDISQRHEVTDASPKLGTRDSILGFGRKLGFVSKPSEEDLSFHPIGRQTSEMTYIT